MKPKILNVEDKRTKFERSKGDPGQFSEFSNILCHKRNWENTWIYVSFKMLVDGNWRYIRGFEAIDDLIDVKLCTDMLY